MPSINIQDYDSPYGELILGSFNDRLCLCDWRYRKMRSTIDARITKGLNSEFAIRKDDVIAEAIKQLEEYFTAERTEFDLPLLMVGTDFQKQVWDTLVKVEFGSTTSYQRLAENMGKPKAVRAVASANGANAVSIFVPCHRVIGKDGSLVGYAGGIQTKQRLLSLENQLSLF